MRAKFLTLRNILIRMARQIDSEITGIIGNVIFYERQGEYLMRSVPFQTIGSQKSAKNYGRASSLSKILRQLLAPLLPNPRDRNMQNRLTPAMRDFLALLTDRKSIQPDDNPLAGFRFVLSSNLKDCLLFPLVINQQAGGNIRLELPAIHPVDAIAAPPGTSRVELQMMAIAIQMNGEQTYAGNPETLSIPYIDEQQPPGNIFLEMDAPAGSIVVVTAALTYWNNEKWISKEGFMPVEIVAVFKDNFF